MNYLIAALIAVAAVTGAYFYGVSAGKDACAAAEAREDRIAQLATDAAATSTAKAIAQIEVRNVTIKQETQREVETRTVYRDCRHSPEQLQRLNATLTGDEGQPAGPGLVPSAGALGR